jgi:hypothetical protein
MSLLTQASNFTTIESGGKKEKMRAKMKETFQRIQQEKFRSQDMPPPSIVQQQEDHDSRAAKVEQMIQNMNMTQPDNAGDGLANFESFTVPTVPKNLEPVQVPPNNMTMSTSLKESFMTPASYGKSHGSSYSNSYGSTPYYQGLSTKQASSIETAPSASSQQLMEKLNYMIHLLEEQQKEPTQNIMEEFVLYGLLGIFMIYIVDSFARVGKYTR